MIRTDIHGIPGCAGTYVVHAETETFKAWTCPVCNANQIEVKAVATPK